MKVVPSLSLLLLLPLTALVPCYGFYLPSSSSLQQRSYTPSVVKKLVAVRKAISNEQRDLMIRTSRPITIQSSNRPSVAIRDPWEDSNTKSSKNYSGLTPSARPVSSTLVGRDNHNDAYSLNGRDGSTTSTTSIGFGIPTSKTTSSDDTTTSTSSIGFGIPTSKTTNSDSDDYMTTFKSYKDGLTPSSRPVTTKTLVDRDNHNDAYSSSSIGYGIPNNPNVSSFQGNNKKAAAVADAQLDVMRNKQQLEAIQNAQKNDSEVFLHHPTRLSDSYPPPPSEVATTNDNIVDTGAQVDLLKNKQHYEAIRNANVDVSVFMHHPTRLGDLYSNIWGTQDADALHNDQNSFRTSSTVPPYGGGGPPYKSKSAWSPSAPASSDSSSSLPYGPPSSSSSTIEEESTTQTQTLSPSPPPTLPIMASAPFVTETEDVVARAAQVFDSSSSSSSSNNSLSPDVMDAIEAEVNRLIEAGEMPPSPFYVTPTTTTGGDAMMDTTNDDDKIPPPLFFIDSEEDE